MKSHWRSGMRFRATLLTLLLVCMLTGCSGGAGISIGNILGVLDFFDNISVTFSVNVDFEGEVEFQWTVDPPWAGYFSDPNDPTTEFFPYDVDDDEKVTIYVQVTPDDGNPVIKSVDVTVIDYASSVETSVMTWGAFGSDSADCICYEGSSLYAGGEFEDTVDFDPSVGEGLHSAVGGGMSLYVSTFDYIEGQGYDYSHTFTLGPASDMSSIDVDSSGNILISGLFYSGCDLDPTPDEYLLSGHDGSFVAKYGPYGSLIWAVYYSNKTIVEEDVTTASIYSIPDAVLDDNGDAWVVVVESQIETGPEYAVTHHIAHLNKFPVSAPSGIHILLEEDTSRCKLEFIDGNIYLAYTTLWDKMRLSDFVSVDGDYGSGLCVCSDDGSLIKSTDLGSTVTTYDMEAGDDNLLYLCGNFSGEPDFDPGPGEFMLYSGSTYNSFLACYDPNLNLMWADGWGNSNYTSPNALAVNESRIYLAGVFNHSVDLAPGSETSEHDAQGVTASYLSIFGIDGAFMDSLSWGSDIATNAHDIALDSHGNALVSGRWNGVADFDLTPAENPVTAAGFFDAYVLEIVL